MKRQLNKTRGWFILLTLGLGTPLALTINAGNLDPPAAPAPTMKTLIDVEPRIPLNIVEAPGNNESCFVITRPGSYYLLGNFTGADNKNGITIEASSVTLDLNGFTLNGTSESHAGIVAEAGHQDITVRNGTVKGWGAAGVNVESAAGSKVKDLCASQNGQETPAPGIAAGFGAIVKTCTASDNNGKGIQVGFGGLVLNCTASGNSEQGIVGAIAATATGAVIRSCAARSNSQAGIQVGDGSVVTDCAAVMNGHQGIAAGLSCVISNNAVTLNGMEGITAFDSLVRGNAAKNNTGAQINAPDSTFAENHS